jgi:hypothetical protein
MRNRVIFLDFDGTLWPYPVRREVPSEAVVRNLNWIVSETGADVVVSATARVLGRGYLNDLHSWGVKADVIGHTPTDVFGGASGTSRMRGREIALWFNEHPWEYDFVVLDDESLDDGPYWVREHLVRTDLYRGLTALDAGRAIRMLRGY